MRRVGPVGERQIYLRKYYPTKCRMVVGEWDSYTASKYLPKRLTQKAKTVTSQRRN